MEQMAPTTIRSGHRNGSASPTESGSFTPRFAIGAVAGYTLFTIAILIATPQAALSTAIWALWVAVVITGIVTFEVGRFRHRRSARAHQPMSAVPSRRMRRWMKVEHH
jgi:hypothetical protein